MVAPSQGRELKQPRYPSGKCSNPVAPSQGRELKRIKSGGDVSVGESPLHRGVN